MLLTYDAGDSPPLAPLKSPESPPAAGASYCPSYCDDAGVMHRSYHCVGYTYCCVNNSHRWSLFCCSNTSLGLPANDSITDGYNCARDIDKGAIPDLAPLLLAALVPVVLLALVATVTLTRLQRRRRLQRDAPQHSRRCSAASSCSGSTCSCSTTGSCGSHAGSQRSEVSTATIRSQRRWSRRRSRRLLMDNPAFMVASATDQDGDLDAPSGVHTYSGQQTLDHHTDSDNVDVIERPHDQGYSIDRLGVVYIQDRADDGEPGAAYFVYLPTQPPSYAEQPPEYTDIYPG